MKILISGGGIAGLALAGFVQEQGYQPKVVEKASEWRRVGYGIALWGNGIRILERLGLEEQFYAHGERIDAWSIRNGQGDVLSQAPLNVERSPPLTAVHRADLHGLLLEKVPEACIQMGTSVEILEQESGGVTATLSDGSRERYDLVVGADGVRSQVRQLAFSGWKLQDTGTAVWSFWIPDEIDAPRGFTEAWYEDGKALLVAPVAGRRMGSVALPVDERYNEGSHLRYLQSKVQRDEWLLPRLVAALDDPDEVYHDRNFQVKARRWHRDRAVLVGDAAHAIHPIAGMGASLALEDAYVLADVLSRAQPRNVGQALGRYVERRQSRVAGFQRQATITRAIAFTRSLIVRVLRDFLVRHTPLFERFFVRQAREASHELFEQL